MNKGKVLPVAYGVAGFLSVVGRESEDDEAAYQAALLSTAAKELSRGLVRKAEHASAQLEASLNQERETLRALVSDLVGCPLDPDIVALRQQNAALVATVKWHVAELEKRRAG